MKKDRFKSIYNILEVARFIKWLKSLRKPRDLNIRSSDNVKLYGDLTYQHYRSKPTGGKEILGKGKVGTELHRDSQTYQYRRRQFNFSNPDANNSYQEEIQNPITGTSINVSEKLINHKDHGSNKKSTKS